MESKQIKVVQADRADPRRLRIRTHRWSRTGLPPRRGSLACPITWVSVMAYNTTTPEHRPVVHPTHHDPRTGAIPGLVGLLGVLLVKLLICPVHPPLNHPIQQLIDDRIERITERVLVVVGVAL